MTMMIVAVATIMATFLSVLGLSLGGLHHLSDNSTDVDRRVCIILIEMP